MEWRVRKSVHLVEQMFKQDLYVPYHAHNDKYMCIVSGGSDFMESMIEYMEKRWSGVKPFLGMV